MRNHIHPHIRKRSRFLEPYPARTYGLRVLDMVVYTVGILGPLFTLPQIAKIYLYQDAAGVSLISWAAFTVFDIPWIVYGYVHRERPIVITYILWLIVNAIVCVGVLLYGKGPLL